MTVSMPYSIVIHRPVEDVFNFVTDFRNDKAWWKLVTHTEMVTPGELGVGSEFVQSAKVLFITIQGRMRVLELDPPNWIRYRSESKQLSYNLLYTFEAVEGGTHFTQDAQLEIKGILRVFRPFTIWFIRWAQQRYFPILKQVLEENAPSKS
ncbi:MAG: SRPBCC family protein [Anaerolineae bacterium]|nr:SRPBCC family protein [Anaerolineae bacterium]